MGITLAIDPCKVCNVRHVLKEFKAGQQVLLTVDKQGFKEGAQLEVVSWNQVSGPLRYELIRRAGPVGLPPFWVSPCEIIPYRACKPKVVAACQCSRCEKYLTYNKAKGDELCERCHPEGIPLAKIRGTLTKEVDRECLDLLAEECAETIQRISKIGRWGWDADFEGTTQQQKLESELGDILAAVEIAWHNGLISIDKVHEAMQVKLAKFREDAAGPKQRLLHARIPEKK